MTILKRRSKTKNALFFRNLNPAVKTMFKTTCVRRGDTMQDVVEALMRAYITSPTIIEKELKKTKQTRERLIP